MLSENLFEYHLVLNYTYIGVDGARQIADGIDTVELSKRFTIYVDLPERFGKKCSLSGPDFLRFVGFPVDTRGINAADSTVRAWSRVAC